MLFLIGLGYEHVAAEDAYLFSVSDLPIMEKFEVQLKENYEEHGGHQPVVDTFIPLVP